MRIDGSCLVAFEHDERPVVRSHRVVLLRVVPQRLLLAVDLNLRPPLHRLLLQAHPAELGAVVPRLVCGVWCVMERRGEERRMDGLNNRQ